MLDIDRNHFYALATIPPEVPADLEHGFLRAAATTGQVHLQAFLHSRVWHRKLQGRLSTCCGSRDNERLHGIIPVLPSV